jgi:hypothetical protein
MSDKVAAEEQRTSAGSYMERGWRGTRKKRKRKIDTNVDSLGNHIPLKYVGGSHR